MRAVAHTVPIGVGPAYDSRRILLLGRLMTAGKLAGHHLVYRRCPVGGIIVGGCRTRPRPDTCSCATCAGQACGGRARAAASWDFTQPRLVDQSRQSATSRAATWGGTWVIRTRAWRPSPHCLRAGRAMPRCRCSTASRLDSGSAVGEQGPAYGRLTAALPRSAAAGRHGPVGGGGGGRWMDG